MKHRSLLRMIAAGTVLQLCLFKVNSALAQAPQTTATEINYTQKARDAATTLARRAFSEVQELGYPKYTGKAGVLLAEGDSWFDYPLYDVLEHLEGRHQYRVESVAKAGDSLESVAYDRVQLSSFALKLSRLASVEPQQIPKAILFSGGGNDVAGPELSLLLNHALSGLPQLNESIVGGVLDVRLRMSYLTWIETATQLSQRYFGRKIPILIHGYDFPVADGRGFLGGRWILPGPWFKPFFEAKGYSNPAANTETLRALVTRFNNILEQIPSTPGYEHVCYVKVAGTLSSAMQNNRYRQDWADELHPTRTGFASVSDRFQQALLECAKG